MASIEAGSGEQVSLNVMPMLGIFSILILFLLMSFSSDPVSHDLNAGIELPQSVTLLSLDEVPTIVIAKDQILVNDNEVVSLENGEFPSNNQQRILHKLDVELEKIADAGKKFTKSDAGLQTFTF